MLLHTMSDSPRNNGNYTEAIRILRKAIETDFSDGGMLPPGREMANRLNISYSTYRKALSFLEGETVVVGYPRSGHYVLPQFMHVKKIGLVFGTGGISPFMRGKSLVIGAMSRLEEVGYEVQILQGATIDSLVESAISYHVAGIVWFFPPSRFSGEIELIEKQIDRPIIVVDDALETIDSHHATITYDKVNWLRERFRLVAEKGHKNILYCGDYSLIRSSGVDKMLEEAGIQFSQENCLDQFWRTPRKLTKTIKKKNITMIVAEGNPLNVKCLFEELAEFPDDIRPALNISSFRQLECYRKHFPNVSFQEDCNQKKRNLGEVAVEILIDHLEKGDRLKSVKI